MAYSFYKILDKNGVEMPDHWSGRRRTYDEAKKMVDGLNKNGEHRPYTMIETDGTMAQQTAMQALVELMKINDIYKPCMPYLLEIIDEVYLPMEKEQMKNIWGGGKWSVELGGEFEQYYKDTYGGQGTDDTTSPGSSEKV